MSCFETVGGYSIVPCTAWAISEINVSGKINWRGSRPDLFVCFKVSRLYIQSVTLFGMSSGFGQPELHCPSFPVLHFGCKYVRRT